MKQDEFARILSKRAKITRSQADRVIEEGIELIKDLLIEGETIRFRRFGVFKIVHRQPRLAYAPKAEKLVEVPERDSPTFSFTEIAKRDIAEGSKI